MIFPYFPTDSSSKQEAASTGLVVEVSREVFVGLLKQGEKPIVFENRGGFPRTYRYFARLGGYFFLYRSREQEDLSAAAHVLPVEGFHAGPASVM